jgi:hypothetical protein
MRPLITISIYLAWGGSLFLGGCGAAMDDEEMRRVKRITCESLLMAYHDAVDAGVEIEPEQMAIVEGCGE